MIHLDISRVRSWTGTDLTRFVEISGNNNMTVTTTPFKTVQDRQETLIPKLTAGVGLNAVRMLKPPRFGPRHVHAIPRAVCCPSAPGGLFRFLTHDIDQGYTSRLPPKICLVELTLCRLTIEAFPAFPACTAGF